MSQFTENELKYRIDQGELLLSMVQTKWSIWSWSSWGHGQICTLLSQYKIGRCGQGNPKLDLGACAYLSWRSLCIPQGTMKEATFPLHQWVNKALCLASQWKKTCYEHSEQVWFISWSSLFLSHSDGLEVCLFHLEIQWWRCKTDRGGYLPGL